MTKLSVNINKIATIRNARGGDVPSVTKAARNIQSFGADGITVHPRPDERHIRYQDVRDLRPLVHTEFNVEGYPNKEFMDLVLEVKPDQVTLVPDPPGVLTSNAGWNTIEHRAFLTEIIASLKSAGIRTSVFIETNSRLIEGAELAGAHRVELYTESYADGYAKNHEDAVRPFVDAALVAVECGLGVNAGHDLNLQNLHYFVAQVPNVLEVSIGHALISDALYLGLESTVALYKQALEL